MDRPMKMNWGCGPVVADGWFNVDNGWSDPFDRVYRSTSDFHDAYFDGIVANHSLQCIEGALLDACVQEFHRLLRPGGRLRVLVPDVVGACEAWKLHEEDWPGFAAITEQWSLDRKFAHYLTWGGQNRSTFTTRTLADLLERNGFYNVRVKVDSYGAITTVDEPEWAWLRTLDSRLGESIVVEAEKP